MKRTFVHAAFLAVLLAVPTAAFEAQPASQEPADPQPGDTFSDALTSGDPGPEMVVVPAGTFRMGCLSAEGCSEYEFSAPVGRFPPNEWGLHDAVGNGWEWVEDCWNDTHEGAPSDASARLEGDCSYHVIRGGSWRDGPRELRSAFRRPVEMRHFKGENFRVARVLAP